MFFLEIRPANQALSTASVPAGRSSHTITRDRLTIGFIHNQCYAFLYEFGDVVVIGESLTAVDSARAQSVISQLQKHPKQAGIPDNDIHFLVAIECKAGMCRLYNSITNARTYFITQKPEMLLVATSGVELPAHNFPLQFSENAKPEYLAYRSVAPEQTHFAGVYKLIAGQHRTVTISTGANSNELLWRLREQFITPKNPEEGIREIGEILQKHISRVLAEAKKPGVLLSGGNDSSLLNVMCTKTHPAIPTYTTSFSFIDPQDQEVPYAKSVADHLRLPSLAAMPTAEEYLHGWVEAIARTGEPLDHLQTVLLHFLYKRIAADGCDMLVCGQMADALFGDALFVMLEKYQGAVNLLKATKLNRPLRWLYNGLGLRHGRLQTLSYEFGDALESPHHVLWTLYRYADRDAIETVFNIDKRAVHAGRAALIKKYLDLPLYDRITVINYMGQAPVPLGQWGRLAEEQQIKFFYPFLTPELVTYLFSLPWEHKMAWNTTEPKHALRVLLRQYGFPESLITRPKQSFGFNIKYWALPDTFFQPVVDMASAKYGKDKLRSLQNGEPAKAMLLWTLLNLYLWEQLFTEKRSIEELSNEILDRRRKIANA